MRAVLAILVSILFVELCGQNSTIKAEGNDSLLDLPIEELLKIKVPVPAALTHFNLAEVPASVTIITSEDIAGSSARNIYDLLEIYVPGAFWMTHEKGPHPVIRGVVANLNYKYLLLVNGRVLNNKAHYGAKTELEMWDLGDIRRLEIIRGPGSVSYGPGAIGGVIHIVTFDGRSLVGPTVTATALAPYRSEGMSYSQSRQSEDFSFYGYASVRQTEGYKPRQFRVVSADQAGYIGIDVNRDQVPLDYFADFQEPQVKLHWDMNFDQSWRLWLRYTQQGAPWASNETKSKVGEKYVNQQSTLERQATVSLERNQQLNSELSLKTVVSFDSMDSEGRKFRLDDPDPDHALNYRLNFAEHELMFHGRLNWQQSPDIEHALGVEYSKDYFGVGWGDDKRNMRLGEGNIVSGADSHAIRPGNRGSADNLGNPFFVGKGWEATTYSLFGETNYKFLGIHRLLISGRGDKNSYTDWLLSPRIAWLTQVTDRQILKLIAQRSMRMNTASQMYTEVTSGKDSTNERLDNIELIYSWIPLDQFAWQVSAFRNHLRAIAFEGTLDLTKPNGTLDLYGIETELSYRSPKEAYGFNYSYVKQLKWELAAGETSSTISYSDYNEDMDGVIQTGIGNDLSNWPNHAAKIFGRINPLTDISVQGDARVYWHWQGEKDGLAGLIRALDGDPDQDKTKETIKKIENKGVYGPEYRVNLSVGWQALPTLRLTLFSQNLLDLSDNKRYALGGGNDSKLPGRVRYVEEPRMVGLKAVWQP